MAKSATLIKAANAVVVEPTTHRVVEILEPLLTYQTVIHLFGPEAKRAIRDGNRPMEMRTQHLFSYDDTGRIWFPFGLYSRAWDALEKAGLELAWRDETVYRDPSVFEPDWESLFRSFDLRGSQEALFKAVAANICGRISAPPAFGKTFCIAAMARLYPRARIDVVNRGAAVIKRLFYDLSTMMIGDVGLVGAGVNRPGHRVQLYCAGSLGHSEANADILLADEVHQLAGDSYTENLARYGACRSFGFSASHDMRQDNKDLRLEGLFGPIIFDRSYQEAEADGQVVPIEVKWTAVRDIRDPSAGHAMRLQRMRHGIWRNIVRNRLIAKDARRYGLEDQVLIMVETIEHLMHLKKLLPEFTAVYSGAGLSPAEHEYYVQHGFIDETEPLMTAKRADMLREQFEKGTLKKAIATSVWNTGVDFVNLAVMIRAEGGASAILDTQVPGRVSRLDRDNEAKVGIVHDYMDQFSNSFRRRAEGRRRNYTAQGWKQTFPKLELGSL